MPRKILVSDTNIWIDLHRCGLLETVFQLPHQFVTTEFVWRELRQPPGTRLTNLGLLLEPLDQDEILELFDLRAALGNSSIPDVSCYLTARNRNWTLLTGDKAVRNSGFEAELDVRGTLWLLDELYEHNLANGDTLATGLEEMLERGARLPQSECEHRLALWRSSGT
ncbi:hypothetical protein [Salicola sp. Rm-C-2C1-2]|uniref:hypothetical protein n=1 Tax=Salicola sp. Rm-C-2C1-2 TaxID=3141321 RepID=UPI0032E497D9